MNQSVSVLEHEELLIAQEPTTAALSADEADRVTSIAESRPGFCTRGLRRVRFAQYAGLVNLGNRTLEILPKIAETRLPEDRCRSTLLRLLRLADGLRIAETGISNQSTCRMPLLDIFIASFFDEVANLIRGGLLRRYEVREEDLTVLRGRLLIGRQIGANALRVDRLACRYDEQTPDNDWNRALKAALRLVRRSSSSIALRRRWSELWPAFDEVGDLSNTPEVFDRLLPDRQARRYEAAVLWARWIVAILSPNVRAGKDAAPGFLVDTNQLFERAVAHHLRRRVAVFDPALQVERQIPGKFLAHITTSPREYMIGLRPDLGIRSGTDLRMIADTKWKRLDVNASGYLEPKIADVHQMLAYAAAFGCEQLALIYPWHDGLSRARETTLELPKVGGVNPRLHIVVIDVGHDDLPVRFGVSTPIVGDALDSGQLDQRSIPIRTENLL